MYPVLLNIGNFQLSAYGFLLSLGIFLGSFTVWRIARGYDLDSEKILDLSFLTIGFGFIAARVVYILTNLSFFGSIERVFLINKYPGLSLFGGLAGGILALAWFARKNKISLQIVGDFGMVGFLLAAFFAEIGCLMGGCGIGVETNLFLGVDQVGVIGKRFPIQFFEAFLFLICFFAFWKAAVNFHIQGSLFAKGLIVVGLIKLIALFFKSQIQTTKVFNLGLNLDFIASVIIFGIGLNLYYQVYRKTPFDDLKKLWKFFSNKKTQTLMLAKVFKWWYNFWVNLRLKIVKGKRKLFKLLNIRPNPENF